MLDVDAPTPSLPSQLGQAEDPLILLWCLFRLFNQPEEERKGPLSAGTVTGLASEIAAEYTKDVVEKVQSRAASDRSCKVVEFAHAGIATFLGVKGYMNRSSRTLKVWERYIVHTSLQQAISVDLKNVLLPKCDTHPRRLRPN